MLQQHPLARKGHLTGLLRRPKKIHPLMTQTSTETDTSPCQFESNKILDNNRSMGAKNANQLWVRKDLSIREVTMTYCVG